MSKCDDLVEALYQVFSTMILFPKDETPYLKLVDIGYAERCAQGHADGFRITPKGYRVATGRWGHKESK